jgi:hypothetical protein
MNMRGGQGHRLILATESLKSDVVADEVLMGVDAIEEEATGALEAASRLVVASNNLVGLGDNCVGRCKGEWDILAVVSTKSKIQAEVKIQKTRGQVILRGNRAGMAPCREGNGGDRVLHGGF